MARCLRDARLAGNKPDAGALGLRIRIEGGAQPRCGDRRLAATGRVAYIKAMPGGVVCENPALCYWAGKDFWVDVNTLKILVSAKAQLEADFIANLERCLYPLIQLQDDWEDADGGPFTEGILAALKTHYTEVPRQAEAHYRVPRPNCRAAAGGEIDAAQRLSRPDSRSLPLPASAGLVMR